MLNPREDVNEHFLARINILSCLRDIRVIIVCTHQGNHVLWTGHRRQQKWLLRVRRPENKRLEDKSLTIRPVEFTRPTSSPRASENAQRTVRVALSHWLELSSSAWNRMNSWRLSRTVRMATGDSHYLSLAVSWWAKRSFLVFFW
jgi:hypothetical protein